MSKKEPEARRAEYYRSQLKKAAVFYEPALRLQKAAPVFSESMAGEYVLSPFLTLFTIWVLKSAARDGVTRLYFLARDGYPAYKMACRLCEHYKLKIACRYLYCSRYSLRVPMYSENPEEMLEYICRNGIDVSLRKVLKRAGLQETSIAQLKQFGVSSLSLDEHLSPFQLGELRKVLRNSTAFLQAAAEASASSWETLRAYFIQEGLAAGEHIGLVDSGWIGSTQKSVCAILKRMGRTADLDGYYWGLYDLPRDMDADRYHAFFFGKQWGLKNKLFFSNCLIEAVFSNTHGTTVSYERQGSSYIPVLQDKSSNTDFLTRFHDLSDRYGECFIKSCSQEIFEQLEPQKIMKCLANSLLTFMSEPTAGEAALFGTLRFSDDLLNDSERELAPIFSAKELRENHFRNKLLNALGYKSSYIPESAWFSGTVRRSSRHIRWHSCSYLLYRLLSYLKKSL